MTKEQAITRVKHSSMYIDDRETADYIIKALEQQKPMEKFENAKDHIYKLAGDYKCWDNRLSHEESLELYNILEQQPSEDCVSRQAVDQLCYRFLSHSAHDIAFYEHFCDLPTVTPTRKEGKWIKKGGSFRCSECFMPEFKDIRALKYCPNCGAKMIKE